MRQYIENTLDFLQTCVVFVEHINYMTDEVRYYVVNPKFISDDLRIQLEKKLFPVSLLAYSKIIHSKQTAYKKYYVCQYYQTDNLIEMV